MIIEMALLCFRQQRENFLSFVHKLVGTWGQLSLEKVKFRTQINMPTFQCSPSTYSLRLGNNMRTAFVFLYSSSLLVGCSPRRKCCQNNFRIEAKNHVSSYFRRTGSAILPSEKRGGFPLVSLIERTCFHLKDVVNIWQSEEIWNDVEILEETSSQRRN